MSALTDYEIWAPVKKGPATLFDRLDDLKDVSLDLENQPVISKKAVFPQNEPLFSYDRTGTVTEPDLNARKNTIVFGIRPCDARSFTLLDPVFEGDVPDPYYRARRSKAALLGIACTDPFVNCFCTSIGGSPFGKEGLDLLFIDAVIHLLLRLLLRPGRRSQTKHLLFCHLDTGRQQTDRTASLRKPRIKLTAIWI